jgi:phosphatidylglycerophosphate synthase
MFDALLRPLIDPVLDRMGAALVRVGIGANPVSLAGAASGALAGVAIGLGQPLAGLVLVLASRLLDGLDCDYVFYLAVPLGFGLAAPGNLPFALLLVATFTLTAVSFLAYAALAAKRGLETRAHGLKSFFYSTGLAEGAETLLAFILMCLWPAGFPVIASIVAGLCLLTVIQRSVIAWRVFR